MRSWGAIRRGSSERCLGVLGQPDEGGDSPADGLPEDGEKPGGGAVPAVELSRTDFFTHRVLAFTRKNGASSTPVST
jgi:hypothetical protein